jgi:hypothetical protein
MSKNIEARLLDIKKELFLIKKSTESAIEKVEEELFIISLDCEEGQIALSLYKSGYRLINWGASLTDTNEEISLYYSGKQIGYWSDGISRNIEDAFKLLGLDMSNYDFCQDICYYLTEISERGLHE